MLPFRGIWTGWRNELTGTSGTSTRSAKSSTWGRTTPGTPVHAGDCPAGKQKRTCGGPGAQQDKRKTAIGPCGRGLLDILGYIRMLHCQQIRDAKKTQHTNTTPPRQKTCQLNLVTKENGKLPIHALLFCKAI